MKNLMLLLAFLGIFFTLDLNAQTNTTKCLTKEECLALCKDLKAKGVTSMENCNPADCDPSNCVPVNCDPANCQPSDNCVLICCPASGSAKAVGNMEGLKGMEKSNCQPQQCASACASKKRVGNQTHLKKKQVIKTASL